MPVTNPSGKLKRSYRKWSSMLQRCYSPSHPAFPYYAKKGIEVCDRWRGKGGYLNFLADLGEPPDGLTLGRINNLKGYSPDNCRWETWKQQAANRSARPQVKGSLRQLARAANIPYHVVYQRVKLLKWDLQKSLSTPVAPRGSRSFVDIQLEEEARLTPEQKADLIRIS